MIAAFEQILLLLTFMVIGCIFGKKGIINTAHTKALSASCVYLFLPCTIFNSFSKNFTRSNLSQYAPLLISSVIFILVIIAGSWLLSGRLTKEHYLRRVFFYSLVAPNYGYVGYAMAEGLYGAEGLLHLILFSLPMSLFTYTIGYSMLAKRPLTLKKLFNPVICAVMLGILVGLLDVKMPSVISQFLSKSAGGMAPVSMLLAGLTISEFDFKRLIPDRNIIFVCLMRLVIIPVCVALALRAITDNQMLLSIAVLFYSMPCGLNTILFPKLVGEDCRSGAQLAFSSVLLALVTIPLCLLLV